MQRQRDILMRLLAASGPSGYEDAPAMVWRGYLDPLGGVETWRDTHGNTYARLNAGGSPRVMIAGHIDEIGLQISYIDKSGFLFFQPIGGWDPQVLVGQRVWIGPDRVPGVIGKKPIHLQRGDERDSVVDIDDLHIDIGAPSADMAKHRVSVGEFAVLAWEPWKLRYGDCIVSRACDDRVGAFVAARVVERLHTTDTLGAEVVAVATAQEEVGLRGATTSAHTLDPDVGFAVDVTFATDDPGTKSMVKKIGRVNIGDGPVVTRGPNTNPHLVDRLIDTAERIDIPYQCVAHSRLTGTDARVMQVSRDGVPTALISIPNRNMHSPSELVSFRDIEHASDLIAETIRGLERDCSFIR